MSLERESGASCLAKRRVSQNENRIEKERVELFVSVLKELIAKSIDKMDGDCSRSQET